MLYGAVGYKVFHSKATQAAAAPEAVPVYYRSAGEAKALLTTVDPAKFTRADKRKSYHVAKEIPGVLVQQPCYCYCQRQGHRGLLDCFRSGHAASCHICIKEALLAGKMHREGKSLEEIRAAIIHGDSANVTASTEPTSSEATR